MASRGQSRGQRPQNRAGESDARRAARERLAARQAAEASSRGKSRRPRKGSAGRRPSKGGSVLSFFRSLLGIIASLVVAVVRAAARLVAAVYRLLGPHGTLVAVAALAAVLLVALVVVPGVQGCMRGDQPQEDPSQQTAASLQAAGEGGVDAARIDEAELTALLGEEVAGQLVEAAAEDEDVAWIAAHPEAYAGDGEAVQAKLLKLAAVEPAAREFVRGFPDAYPADAAQPYDGSTSGVPRLYQWDPRWGYTVYCSTTFALTGCCPTSLSMVVMALLGDASLTPYEMGKRAQDGGYMDTFNGTSASFLVDEASRLGLSCAQQAASAENLTAALGAGSLVICNMGPGDFTTTGHYIVATGLAADGSVQVNDPYSQVRSEKTWSAQTIAQQAGALYVYAAR